MPLDLLPLPIYLLAGGQSSRFGADKTRALLHGRPLIALLAEQLAPLASQITVVAGAPDLYLDLGLRTIADRSPGRGPLAGLQAALEDCPHEGWLALVAGDWVGIDVAWLQALADAATPDAHCVIYQDGPYPEPLLGLYHTSIRPLVEQHLASDRRAMRALIAEAPCVRLQPPPDWPRAANINRPEDLQRFMQSSTSIHPASPRYKNR